MDSQDIHSQPLLPSLMFRLLILRTDDVTRPVSNVAVSWSSDALRRLSEMVTVFEDGSVSTAFSNGRLPFCSLINGGRTRTTTYSDVVSGLSEAVSK